MKKKLSMLLAAAMTVSMVPMTAFATTNNYVTNRVTVGTDTYMVVDAGSGSGFSKDDQVTDGSKTVDNTAAPYLVIENNKRDLATASYDGSYDFELTLKNAEWKSLNKGVDKSEDELEKDLAKLIYLIDVDGTNKKLTNATTYWGSDAQKAADDEFIKVDVLTDDSISVTITPKKVISSETAALESDALRIYVPILAKATDEGEATITVNPGDNSKIDQNERTFASITSGGTKTTISDITDIGDANTGIKAITIEETTQNTLKFGTSSSPEKIKLKLSGNFKYGNLTSGTKDRITAKISTGVSNSATVEITEINDDKNEAIIDMSKFNVTSANRTGRIKIVVSGIQIYGDDAKADAVCEVTLSGASMDKATIVAGAYKDYGLSLTAEDKEIPVMYSGTRDSDDFDNESLKVTLKENVDTSWLIARKTKFTFPEGVKIVDVDVSKIENIKGASASDIEEAMKRGIDGREITMTGKSGWEANGKIKVEATFMLSIDPEFTGDIDLTVSGAAINGDDMTVTVAKAEAPITVTAETNEVKIDYRNVTVGDITIKENYAGALKENSTLVLEAENMTFETGIKGEVTEGDLKLDTVKKGKDGKIEIKIDSESGKDPSTIKLTGVSLFLDRTLPTGDYALNIVPADKGIEATSVVTTSQDYNKKDAFFMNYAEDADSKDAKGAASDKANENEAHFALFETDSYEVMPNFIKVITAARDQDDSTFTTKISVTIGATEITAGDKTVPLDVPAFIENGYTMLPVRAVTEALSGTAVVGWNDPEHQITITFGSRIVSMKVGSNIMTINGTQIPMSSEVIIKDSRSFVPLRDLGVALGLSESKINWDDATKTATLN